MENNIINSLDHKNSKIMNFYMAGKLGDFILSIFAVKTICQLNNAKANFYIYEQWPNSWEWEHGIQNTYNEFYPIIISQDYINSFNILNINDTSIDKTDFIHLGEYINSDLLYKNCWSEIFGQKFNFNFSRNDGWIKYDKKDPQLEGKVIIHRRRKYPSNPEFPYDQIIDQNKGNIVFISTSEDDFNEFAYKDSVEFKKINTMEDWFTSINSAKMVVSNISSPACMANSLNKLRIIELHNSIDSNHWIGEEKYNNNIFWFYNKEINHMPKFLN